MRIHIQQLHVMIRLFTLGGIMALSSCSFYQLGQHKPEALETVKTIYIATPIVSINPSITQAPIYLKNQLNTQVLHRTPYQLKSKESADATLIVQINEQSTTTIQRSNDNLLRGSAYQLRLKSNWKIVQGNQTLLSGNINEESLFVSQDPEDTDTLSSLERTSWTLAHQEAVKQALERIAGKVATELTINF